MLNVNTTIKQGFDSNRCWAATAWCIGEFIIPKYPSYEAFAKDVGVNNGIGQDLPQTINHIINKYGPWLQLKQKVLLRSEVMAEINDSMPFAMVWENTAGSKLAHMTTGCGFYYDGSSFEVGIMDSLEGGDIWIEQSNDGNYLTKMAGINYRYIHSATIQ